MEYKLFNRKNCILLIFVAQAPGHHGGSVVKNKTKQNYHCRRGSSISEFAIPLEKEMATHSFILALEIPWTEEPLQTRLND